MIATIDFETTGFTAGVDEVLQVSIIDENKCAEYYGYEFKAHDSLEDAKATLYCYKKMEEGRERKC